MIYLVPLYYARVSVWTIGDPGDGGIETIWLTQPRFLPDQTNTFGENGAVHADKMRQELNIEEAEAWLETVEPQIQIQTQTHQSQPS